MAVAKKRRRKLHVQGRLFLWYIADDYDSADQLLHVVSEDKRFNIQYALGQSVIPAPYRAHLIVVGAEFPGLRDSGGIMMPVAVPDWGDDRLITPGFVRTLIAWSLSGEKTIEIVGWCDRNVVRCMMPDTGEGGIS